MPRAIFGVAAAVAAAALLTTEASAQDPQPPATPRSGDTELVFEREVFAYPSFTRRNPFSPLLGANGGGPRFEQLSLIGVMYSPDPAGSVAVVSTGGVEIAEDGTTSPVEGDAYNLKVGDRIGNTRIVEIRRGAVVVDVEVFDSVERHIMNFASTRQGGSR